MSAYCGGMTCCIQNVGSCPSWACELKFLIANETGYGECHAPRGHVS